MNFKNLTIWTASWAMLSIGAASADSISPDSFSATLGLGESVTIDKTVTITEAPPTDALVDIFFLADETGSMFSQIANVKAAASSILASTGALGDVNWGVGGYRDVGDAWDYREITDLTGSAGATAGINTWVAGGGGDTPEAQLYALETLSTGVSWRAASTRILVWFGDQPGHDPRLGSTEASATAALLGESIIVHALDTAGGLNSTGQATRISDATGGTYGALGTDVAAVTAAITAAITASFATYSTVDLGLLGDSSCVDVATSPAHVGSWDRSVERTFDFDVTFTGAAIGDCSFAVTALVDGGIVARELDDISVVPLPATLPLLFGALLAGGAFARRRKS